MSFKLINGNEILDKYKKAISTLRTGRINSSILENVLVFAYGTKMHVHELATITTPEPSQLLITPFDKNLISAISEGITKANVGANPSDDGAGVRLIFAPLTEETRKLRVKELHVYKEEARKHLRMARQDLMKAKKHEKEEGLVGEDDLKGYENNLQKEVDALNLEIDKITKQKEEEIMKV